MHTDAHAAGSGGDSGQQLLGQQISPAMLVAVLDLLTQSQPGIVHLFSPTPLLPRARAIGSNSNNKTYVSSWKRALERLSRPHDLTDSRSTKPVGRVMNDDAGADIVESD